MNDKAISRNLKEVRERIREAARKAGRNPDEITLLAVSKVHTADSIRAAFDAGHRDFGENYAQELASKAGELEDLEGLRWHFIGHLQTNKAKYVAPVTYAMHTFDSVKIVKEVGKRASASGRKIEAFVQVNVAGEKQKSGCTPEQAEEICDAVDEHEALVLSGLMVLPPWDLDPEEARPYFVAIRKLRDTLGGEKRLPHLSMGMSHDYEVAIAEGATIVRVGTAIFGERKRS